MSNSKNKANWPDQLMRGYARLGVAEWRESRPRARRRAADRLGVDIADNEQLALRAVVAPFSDREGGDFRLIPMPRMPRRVASAFFAPIGHASADRMLTAFDLVVVNEARPIAFRFEPGHVGAEQRHGYDHVQLSEKVARRSIELNRAVQPLPVTYPAVPLPSHDTTTRFLAMVVAMHGFPDGTRRVVEEILEGRMGSVRGCMEAVDALLSGKRTAPRSASA